MGKFASKRGVLMALALSVDDSWNAQSCSSRTGRTSGLPSCSVIDQRLYYCPNFLRHATGRCAWDLRQYKQGGWPFRELERSRGRLTHGTHTCRWSALRPSNIDCTALGASFLRGERATCRVEQFPNASIDTMPTWQEGTQNFTITAIVPTQDDTPPYNGNGVDLLSLTLRWH